MHPTVTLDVKEQEVEKPFLTYSTWQAYLDCPAAFYFRYFTQLRFPQRWGFAFGKAWDIGLNTIAQDIIDGKPVGAQAMEDYDKTYKSEMSDAYFAEADLFTPAQKRKLIEKNDGALPEEEVANQTEHYKTFWHGWGAERLEAYVEKIAPTLKPKEVQKSFFMDFGEQFPFGFKGTMDRIDMDGAVVDNKTSKTRWGDSSIVDDFQGVGYSLAYRILNGGEPEDRVQFDVLVKTKTQSFDQQFQQLVIGIEPHRFDIFLSELSQVYEAVTQGRIYRRLQKYSGVCNRCDYHQDCMKPSQAWSRPPMEEEIAQWRMENPDATEGQLEKWVMDSTQSSRVVNWHQVGAELRTICEQNPQYVQFWY